MKLLVGFDGSDEARDALELVRVLGSAEETRVVVATVLPYDPLPMTMVELERDAEKDAEPLLSEAREALGGLAVETRAFGGGSPAALLTDLGDRERVDAVVIGSSHRGALGRALMGGVGRGLLHGSTRPVAVAPRGYAGEAHGSFARVAVAYDGTAESKLALAEARRIAEAHGASVLVLTAFAPPVALPGTMVYAPAEEPDPKEIAAEGVAALGPRVEAESRVLGGPAADSIASACGADSDLLVAGSRGYGPVARVLMGSVATRLIDISPCPVLVTPRPE